MVIAGKTPHEDLHSEQGALPGDRPTRARNAVIKVEDLAWLEFEKPDLDAAERFARDATGAADDVGGLLSRLLDEVNADALLLRPDRVVAASGDRADLRRWHRLLTSAGITAASP